MQPHLIAILLYNAIFPALCAENPYMKHKVVPDVIDSIPGTSLSIDYPSGAEVDMGNVLTPTLVKDAPIVRWDFNPDTFYSLLMVDPDSPSKEQHSEREWLHWLIVNIKGENVSSGSVIAPYIGSIPLQETGMHRYVLLAFEQPISKEFGEIQRSNSSTNRRAHFNSRQFADKNQLKLYAGNFFQAAYDDYVTTLYRLLN